METNIRFNHQDLVEKSKSGDSSSQYQLYSLYVNAMYNVSMRFLGTKEDAEDIVQDSFVEAFKKLETFKYESTFGAWLKRIVINKSINYLKAKRIKYTEFDGNERDIDDEEPNYEVDTVEIEKVKKGIALLSLGYRQIINLYLLEGYDHVEIGEILGISTSTSKSQYHRAKKKLIQIIKEL